MATLAVAIVAIVVEAVVVVGEKAPIRIAAPGGRAVVGIVVAGTMTAVVMVSTSWG